MSHLEDIGKDTYMQEQGYEWVKAYEAYIHRQQWKVFSRNYLEDHSFDDICAKLAEAPVEGKWRVYSNTESEVDIHNIHKHYGAAD
jgi:hypothetical protein